MLLFFDAAKIGICFEFGLYETEFYPEISQILKIIVKSLFIYFDQKQTKMEEYSIVWDERLMKYF
jgi:hypothetical protein